MKRLYSLTVSVHSDTTWRSIVDPSARTVLFRAVRELLINVAKHANTDIAHVDCRIIKGQIVVTVADSGKGFEPEAIFSEAGNRGFGLISIRERLVGLGGTMDCESSPGNGSRVTLKVPVTASTGLKEKEMAR